MIFNFNFNLSTWVKQLQIEADTEEAAKQKLMSMTLSEIITDDTFVADSAFEVSDISSEVSEYSLIVKVTDVEYDFDPEIMDVAIMEYLKSFLPKEYTLTLEDVTDSDDVEELISDAIFSETNYDTKSFEFQVLEKK